MVPIIGLDVDDVLCDFRGRFLEYYNTKFFTSLKFTDLHAATLYESIGINKYLANNLYYEFFQKEWHNISLFPEAVSILQKNKTCHFAIVSHRKKYLENSTHHWAKEILGSGLIATKCLGNEESGAKGIVAKRLGCNFFIEDKLSVAYDIASHGITVFLLNYPWNQKENLPKGIIRVNSWKEIDLLLERHLA